MLIWACAFGWAVLLSFGPNANPAVLVDFDMYNVRPAANRAVLDVLLRGAGRQVDRHHDFLTAGVADVAAFVTHRNGSVLCLAGYSRWSSNMSFCGRSINPARPLLS